MKVKLDIGAKMPTQAHPGKDAGWDLYAPEDIVVPARRGILWWRREGSAVIDTGVHVQLPRGTAGLIVSKSGLNVKHGITSTGLIDQGYTGSIHVKLYNHSRRDYHVQRGDKISQLCVLCMMALPSLELVDELDESERGARGFGSTGR